MALHGSAEDLYGVRVEKYIAGEDKPWTGLETGHAATTATRAVGDER